ncbi:MAG: hypothetical protein B7Z55_19045, partial [Planctomycetales bacterium 12-60-4]
MKMRLLACGSAMRLAKHRIGGAWSPVSNEQDLAQSVFLALWKGAEAGKWDGVKDRDELWWVLLEITRRKVLRFHAHRNAAKRSGNVVSLGATAESDVDGESTIALPEPTDMRELLPDAALVLKDEHNRLMQRLRDDVLRTVATLKLEGYSHKEIAQSLHVNERTVIRKLNLIRE